jgi:hypothetical protein
MEIVIGGELMRLKARLSQSRFTHVEIERIEIGGISAPSKARSH